MEGYCIGEKEYFSSEEISLYIKDSEDNLHYCEKGAFVGHDGKISLDEISDTINKIAGGDGKFVNIKGGLPELSTLKK